MAPRTHTQYLLQKARALATTLRCTLEELQQEDPHIEDDLLVWTPDDFESMAEDVGSIEEALDEMDPTLIGSGSVALTVEPFS